MEKQEILETTLTQLTNNVKTLDSSYENLKSKTKENKYEWWQKGATQGIKIAVDNWLYSSDRIYEQAIQNEIVALCPGRMERYKKDTKLEALFGKIENLKVSSTVNLESSEAEIVSWKSSDEVQWCLQNLDTLIEKEDKTYLQMVAKKVFGRQLTKINYNDNDADCEKSQEGSSVSENFPILNEYRMEYKLLDVRNFNKKDLNYELPNVQNFDEYYVNYELSGVQNLTNGQNYNEHHMDYKHLDVLEFHDLESENGSSDDESEDSHLKEIYIGQSFTSFDLLEKCLKHYSIRIGFETRIVRSEKDDNDIIVRKTYKCRHGEKYLAKKKLDPTENRDRESGYMESTAIDSVNLRIDFEKTKLATNSLQPKMILTDADLAMQVAITTKYPEAIVRHYVFHIQQNLVKKLKNLHNKWDDFISDFYVLRNSLVVSDFECRWMELMNNYSEVQKYCDRVLYPTKKCWAHSFMKRKFSANTHSTQRVESINHVMKLEVNSGNSLCQLQTALQMKQIFESLLYRSLLYDKLNVNSSQQLDHRAEFIEDNYKEPQILLSMALEDCSDQELSIQLVQNNIKLLPTRTFEVLERIREQEVNSQIAVESDSRKVFYAITNGSNMVLEDILHQVINEQTSAQSNNNGASDLSEQGTCQEIDSFKISNPSQHKGRGRSVII
ncbi:41042_t:CDS:10 [Gigaspora margarita]|uniref:41042_t:CDS:1 n=1 Tax=Gigaspora margarita TaxID=4874 RepID=A0ABM8VXZ4_GIGMA|nr:41042_t:CDS:10 [Gigaspora margarita]